MVKKFRTLRTTICRVIKKLKGLFRIALVSSLATIKHMHVQFHTGAFLKIVLTKYVHMYKEYHSVCPRRNWDSPNPFLASECSPPPRNRGEGAY
jgi:hypothetical protein